MKVKGKVSFKKKGVVMVYWLDAVQKSRKMASRPGFSIIDVLIKLLVLLIF